MSTQITTAFVNQFSSNIYYLAQQKGSVLRGHVRSEIQKGATGFYDQIGQQVAALKTGRHSSTPQNDTPHSRRAVTLADYEQGDLIDNADKIRLLIDPASGYTQAFMWAFGRAMDDVIIAAARGTAATGVAGAGTVALPVTQKFVPTNGTTVSTFNIDALLKLKYMFDSKDIDPSVKRHLAVGAQQIQDLLNDTKVTSADYATVRALAKGELNEFMGFNFHMINRLPSGASGAINQATGAVGSGSQTMTNARSCLAWAEDGVLLAIGEDMKARMAERPDKSFSLQVFAAMSLGAVRMEEEKVVEILCKESNSVVA